MTKEIRFTKTRCDRCIRRYGEPDTFLKSMELVEKLGALQSNFAHRCRYADDDEGRHEKNQELENYRHEEDEVCREYPKEIAAAAILIRTGMDSMPVAFGTTINKDEP